MQCGAVAPLSYSTDGGDSSVVSRGVTLMSRIKSEIVLNGTSCSVQSQSRSMRLCGCDVKCQGQHFVGCNVDCRRRTEGAHNVCMMLAELQCASGSTQIVSTRDTAGCVESTGGPTSEEVSRRCGWRGVKHMEKDIVEHNPKDG